jgi:hypothetical protein
MTIRPGLLYSVFVTGEGRRPTRLSAEHSFGPSAAASDLIRAVTRPAAGAWQYQVIGTAGGDDGAVVTTLLATSADGAHHLFEVTVRRHDRGTDPKYADGGRQG